jgi:predicted DNA-binding transcriptional regulator AlpA
MAAPRAGEPRDAPITSVSVQSALAAQEHFVDADTAAAFLSLSRKHVLKLARLGLIPAYPISFGSRSVWRFRLSELENWMISRQNGLGGSRKGRA